MEKNKKIYDVNDESLANIPSEKFTLSQTDKKISDVKFDDKPIGYFKDAWMRFKKNKASIAGAIIIICIALYSLLTPLLTRNFDSTFMDTYYAKKAPRNLLLRNIGIADGTTTRDFQAKAYVLAISTGVAAEDYEGNGNVTLQEGMDSYYQPIRKLNNISLKIAGGAKVNVYNANIDNYLETGFIYKSIQQSEYAKIREWEEETGLHVLYPLIENNEYTMDNTNANYWYKTDSKGNPVTTTSGKAKKIDLTELDMSLVLEDNYMRDNSGNPVYYVYSGGGTTETAEYKVRILYYNYYRYQNGFEPEYLFGTDSQGYDLSLRMAEGVRLSLFVAICVSLINLVIGGIYGAIEGYYGGLTDLIMERITDILANVPFIIVATLFQLHLASKVGPVVCLLFAYILTGWIGIAGLVRTQFYRFKNQEYVMSARTLGASDFRIITKHIYPNAIGTMITSCALIIPGVIGTESMLSYLGIVKLGGKNGTSLGTLLSDASGIWTNYPHLMIFPALVISLLMISFNLFGNGLRDAFNPSLRGTNE